MNKKVYMILLTITCFQSTLITGKSHHYIDKIKSFLSRPMREKIDQYEYQTSAIESITLTNINGTINVQTGPKKSLFIKTISRARKQDDLDAMSIAIDESKSDQLVIATHYKGKNKSHGSVEYQLIVPASLNIRLNVTGNGNVSIKNIHGSIDVVANDNITISNTKRSVSVQTRKKGSIAIANSFGPVEARSYAGTIQGENITHNFSAHTTKGDIKIACKKIQSTGRVDLKTIGGNIILALPTDTNAEIKGHTTNGTFLCDHPIALKSYTTPLNKSAWNRFKKEVDGILGSGEAAIALHSTKGNIKVI